MAIGYEYKMYIVTSNILGDATSKDLHLVWNINHEIYNIPQCLPPNVKIDTKLQLAPSRFILQKVVGTAPDVLFSLFSAILHVRKQQVINFVALPIEKLGASRNNIKLLVPHTITNRRYTASGSSTKMDSSLVWTFPSGM